MNRQRFALALTCSLLAMAGAAAAQAAGQSAPAAQAPAARPRLTAPIRGVAQLAVMTPKAERKTIGGKQFIVTTIQVKNTNTGAIAGLRAEDFWYDSKGNPVTGDDFRLTRPLQPGETATITLETPVVPNMNRNQYSFKHANGEIKANAVTKF